MTMTKPDRAELRRLLAEADRIADEGDDEGETTCARCHEMVSVGDDLDDPTGLCHGCAQWIVDRYVPALLDAADQAEELEAHGTEIERLRRLYEDEVSATRKALEEDVRVQRRLEAENARLRAEVERLRDELDDVCEFCQEKCKHAAARKGGE